MTDPLDRSKLAAARDVVPPKRLGESDSAQTQVDLALRDPNTLSARERTYLNAQKKAMAISGEFGEIRNSLMSRPGDNSGLIKTCTESISRLEEMAKDLNAANKESVSPFAAILKDQGKKLEQTRALTRPVQVPSELKKSVALNPDEPESEISQLSRAISRVEAVSQMISRGMTGINQRTIDEELKDLNNRLEASKRLHRDEISGGIEANKNLGDRKASVGFKNNPGALSMHQTFDTGASRTYNKRNGQLVLKEETLSGGTQRAYENFDARHEDTPLKGDGIVASIEVETLPGGYQRHYVIPGLLTEDTIEKSDDPVRIYKVEIPEHGISIRYAHALDSESGKYQTYVDSLKIKGRRGLKEYIKPGTLSPLNSREQGNTIFEKDLQNDGFIDIFENGKVEIKHEDGRYTVISSIGDHIEHSSYKEALKCGSMPPLFMSQGDGTHLNLIGKMREKSLSDGTLSIADFGASRTLVRSDSEVVERAWLSNED